MSALQLLAPAVPVGIVKINPAIAMDFLHTHVAIGGGG